MIKIGNILINPEDISSIHRDMKPSETYNNKSRGFDVIQIIYKNGVVNNITSQEVGMSYNSFIKEIQEFTKKQEDNRLLRMIVALKSINNG